MEAEDRAGDESFAVWPFRRQLVERLSAQVANEPAPRRRRSWIEDTQPIEIVPLVEPPRPGPLRLAVPFALVAFCAGLAGSAAFSGADRVGGRLDAPIVQAAEAAPAATTAAKPVAAKPKHARRKTQPKRKPAAPARSEELVSVRTQAPVAAPAPPPPPLVIVNGVVGLPRSVAARALQAEGLGVRVYGVPSGEPAGTVVAQHPRGGTRAEAGSYVRINVSAR